jgi:phosphoribosylformylglycinamidine synthase
VLDLNREGALHRVLVEGAGSGLIRSAQDCSEGGLAVTIAECCSRQRGWVREPMSPR